MLNSRKMVQKGRTTFSGKVQAANTKIQKSAKLFFQILQCLHHLSVCVSDEGSLPKSFQKKQTELDKFVRPAQEYPSSAFRDTYSKLIHSFFLDTLAALSHHYSARLGVLGKEIQNLGITHLERQAAYQIAVRWGKKNFGSKLSNQTLQSFASKVKELIPDPLSSIRYKNSTPFHTSTAHGIWGTSFFSFL